MGGMFSSSATTKSNQYGQNYGTNTSVGGFSNPLLNNFQNQMMGNIQQGMNQANQPLYGQAQIGSYAGNLNQLANSSIASLRQNLARTGGLQGGGAAQGATAIGMGKMGNLSNYMANLPMMNRQAQLQGAQTYGGLGNQLMSTAPRTQYGQQYGTNTGTGQSQQTMTPSIMSDIGQIAGIAGGFMGMPGLSNFFGNQGQQYVNPNPGVQMPTFYGDQSGYNNPGMQQAMGQLYSNQPQQMQPPPFFGGR